jgi:hypothetical protein
MGKKSSDPLQAARKAARARELARNKAARDKVRDEAAVRRDMAPLEAQLRAARRAGDAAETARLERERTRVLKLKEDFVKLHPASRKLVFPERSEDRKEHDAQAQAGSSSGAAQAPHGAPGSGRVPERSIYYDAVFNPSGAPPPGMPYREKRECSCGPGGQGRVRAASERVLCAGGFSCSARAMLCMPASWLTHLHSAIRMARRCGAARVARILFGRCGRRRRA